MTGSLPAWAPRLRRVPAKCARCAAAFKAEISAPIYSDDGTLLRGPRRLHSFCLSCRTDDGKNQDFCGGGGRRRAYATG